jgi:chromosomal replication initiation ATPase DnaA
MTTINEILDRIAAMHQVPVESLTGPSREANLVRIRDVACYFLAKLGYGHKEIGDHLNRERSTISYAVQRVDACYDMLDPISKWMATRANETLTALFPSLIEAKPVKRLELSYDRR